MFVRLVAAAVLVLAAPVAASARPVVVELFTSEGCSSCPPADAYLSELSRERQDVLPLAFHVTYWNNLGWADPYSFESATERQAAYDVRFGDGSYTPEMVIDGRKGLVGSDRSAVEVAIRAAQRIDDTGAQVEGVRRAGLVSITVGAGSGSGQVLLIGYDPDHTTAVGRGENSGRTLRESNIVRSIQPIGNWTGAPLTLESAAPAGEQAAVIIQSPDGAIVGAARIAGGTH
ncbi:DUF1223 domain-containing protein [Paraburkholderia sp. J12]|uniref:DUF1223 domain-containing protein n=1 Tax=Paraburkholderia sp. J12 TaxID=2805432 RepID=UPI002ABDB7F7|nr:DUF1223 domain-containing protein [Paraburkholderia sp. J12]